MTIVKEQDRFKDLLGAVENGWEIDEPVLEGTMWHTGSNRNQGVYHFVLRNKFEDKTILLSLPASPALQIYLSENNIRSNSLSQPRR